jgi:hypothetical protein
MVVTATASGLVSLGTVGPFQLLKLSIVISD